MENNEVDSFSNSAMLSNSLLFIFIAMYSREQQKTWASESLQMLENA